MARHVGQVGHEVVIGTVGRGGRGGSGGSGEEIVVVEVVVVVRLRWDITTALFRIVGNWYLICCNVLIHFCAK